MGKAIRSIQRYELSKEEKMEKDLQEVQEAVADNKEAILKGIGLLRALDEEGTLDTMTAFTKTKDEAMANLVKEIDKDQYEPLLRNLPELFFLLGEINVGGMREVASRLNNGIKAIEGEGTEQKTSFLDLAKALKDPEINRSITMMMHFLKGMGRS